MSDMESNSNAMAVEAFPSPPYTKTVGWVPFAGTKRKAHMADIDDNFDIDCRPAPAKQFAVDEEVAGDILRDGFYYDPSMPPETMPPLEDEDMEEDESTVVVQKHPGDRNDDSCGGMKLEKLQGEECRDTVTRHSVHEYHSKSATQSLSMTGVSLVLSDEIQETLLQSRLNEDLTLKTLKDYFSLQKPLTDTCASSRNSSMALVIWKPPEAAATMGHVSCQPSQVKITKEALKEKVLQHHENAPGRHPTDLIKVQQPSPISWQLSGVTNNEFSANNEDEVRMEISM